MTGARDVPVCMGTATRPACKYYKASNAGTDAAHWCMAMYDLVTGEQMVVACVNARADMRGCGRDGSFYEPMTGWSKVRVGP